MKVKILGSLEIVSGDRTFGPSSPKVCQLLALLVGNPNVVVSTDAIIGELWGEDPPHSVTTTLQTYVYRLRRALEREFPDEPLANALVTQSPGYRLAIAADDVDANVFERLVIRGKELFTAGEIAEACNRFAEALALWNGDALANVPQQRRLGSLAVQLEERRMEVVRMKITAEMRLGMHAELISELRTCIERHPLDEWFVAQLMCALARSGRSAEALTAFQRAYTMFDQELALEPSAKLTQLQVAILNGDEGFRGLAPMGSDEAVAEPGNESRGGSGNLSYLVRKRRPLTSPSGRGHVVVESGASTDGVGRVERCL